jgi:hypothetical protein
MAWTMAEAVADNVMAYIASAQTAKVAAVAARYSAPSLTMPVFVEVRHSDPDQEREPQFPVLYVVPESSTMDPGPGGFRRGSIVDHRFLFFVMVAHPGTASETPAETVARLTKRYVVAVLEMLAEYYNGTTRPEEWGTGGAGISVSYDPIARTAGGAEYLGSATISIGCLVHEGAI